MLVASLVGVVVWIFLCALTAAIAEKKGHKGLGYCLLAIFLSPVVGLIVVACISNKNKKECPFCRKSIDVEASVCGYCGKELKKSKSINSEKNTWISKRILELINEGRGATDAKIQAEAEYSLNDKKQSENTEIK